MEKITVTQTPQFYYSSATGSPRFRRIHTVTLHLFMDTAGAPGKAAALIIWEFFLITVRM